MEAVHLNRTNYVGIVWPNHVTWVASFDFHQSPSIQWTQVYLFLPGPRLVNTAWGYQMIGSLLNVFKKEMTRRKSCGYFHWIAVNNLARKVFVWPRNLQQVNSWFSDWFKDISNSRAGMERDLISSFESFSLFGSRQNISFIRRIWLRCVWF